MHPMSGAIWVAIEIAFLAVLAIAMAWVQSTRRDDQNSDLLRLDLTDGKPMPRRWQQGVILALSLWLCLSPLLLWPNDIPPPPLTAAVFIIGVLLATLTLLAASYLEAPTEVAAVVAGGWVFAAPWLYGFDHLPLAAWDHWIVGTLIAILAGWELHAFRPLPPHLVTMHPR